MTSFHLLPPYHQPLWIRKFTRRIMRANYVESAVTQAEKPMNDPTHGDILEKLGELKGQVSTLIGLVGQKREDINALYSRVSLLEKTTASRDEVGEVEKRMTDIEKDMAKELGKWVGITLSAALVFSVFAPRIQKALGIVEQKIEHRK